MNNKEIFTDKISSILCQYEPTRKRILKDTLWKIFFIAVIICVSFYIFASFPKDSFCSDAAYYVFVISILFILSFIYIRTKSFKIFLKDKCYNQIKKIFNLEYKENSKEIESLLAENDIFSSFNKFEIDDNMYGVYNGVKYTLSEIELSDIQYEYTKKEFRIRIFKGLVICFPSNKKIKSDVFIFPKKSFNNLNISLTSLINVLVFLLPALLFLGCFIVSLAKQSFMLSLLILLLGAVPWGYIIFTGIRFYKNIKKMRAIKLEDVLFAKKYKIYSNDPVEARYLITPTFMERFKNLKIAFGNKNIKCSFYKGQVIFAIPTKKDLFELGSLFTSLEKNNKHIENFYEEIKSIHDMIDYFKLYQQIGL